MALESYQPTLPNAGEILMFTTTWCGYCDRLKSQLKKADISWTEINIEEVSGSAEYVASVNNGNQTVPTVVFPDGSTATNPSLRFVQDSLAN